MPRTVPHSPSQIAPLLLVVFIISVVIGIGFSFGNAIGWDLASFFGFAVG